MADVVGEVGRHVVPPGVAGPGRPGKADPEGCCTDRGEQLSESQRSRHAAAGSLGGLEDHEVAPLLREEVADRQAGLTTADHNHLTPLTRQAIDRILVAHVVGHVRRLPLWRFAFAAAEE